MSEFLDGRPTSQTILPQGRAEVNMTMTDALLDRTPFRDLQPKRLPAVVAMGPDWK